MMRSVGLLGRWIICIRSWLNEVIYLEILVSLLAVQFIAKYITGTSQQDSESLGVDTGFPLSVVKGIVDFHIVGLPL